MKKITSSLIIFSASVMPYLAMAQTTPTLGPVGAFIGNISIFINKTLIPLVFGIALLVFIYGMFKYFIQGGDSDAEREKGKEMLVWSVAGFVLMVSIWGIVNIVATGLFGSTSSAPPLPDLPTVSGNGGYGTPSSGAQ